MLESRTGFRPHCGCGWNAELNPDTETPTERGTERGARGRPHAHTAGHTHTLVHMWLAAHTCTHMRAYTCPPHSQLYTHVHTQGRPHARAHVEGEGLRPRRAGVPRVGAAGWSLTSGCDLGQEQGSLQGFEKVSVRPPQKGVPSAQLPRHCGAALGRVGAAGDNRLPCACAGTSTESVSGLHTALPRATHSPRSRARHGGSGGRRRGLGSLTGQSREDETGPGGASGAP